MDNIQVLAYIVTIMFIFRAFTWLVALFSDIGNDNSFDWAINSVSVLDAINDLWWIRVLDWVMIFGGMYIVSGVAFK